MRAIVPRGCAPRRPARVGVPRGCVPRASASASSSARLSAKCTWLEHWAGFCRRDSLIGAVWWPRAGRCTLGDPGADARQGRSVRRRICTATSGGSAFGQTAREPDRQRSEPTGADWTRHCGRPTLSLRPKPALRGRIRCQTSLLLRSWEDGDRRASPRVPPKPRRTTSPGSTLIARRGVHRGIVPRGASGEV